MANGNGRKAQPKNGAKMGIMGTIHLELKREHVQELVAGEQVTIDLGHAREFYLHIETGPEDRIVELTPWFDPDSAEVKVENSFQTDGGGGYTYSLSSAVEFKLTESENSSLGFCVTAEQAKALAKALMSYAQAWDACEALKAEQPHA